MKNAMIRITFGGCTVVAKNDDRRLELEIPSGIEFRMEGDWEKKNLSKREIKDLANACVDKIVEQIPERIASAPEAVATSAPAPTRTPSVDEVNKALEEAYNQGKANCERALYDEIRTKVDSNNAAIQEVTKTLSDLAKEIGMMNRPKK